MNHSVNAILIPLDGIPLDVILKWSCNLNNIGTSQGKERDFSCQTKNESQTLSVKFSLDKTYFCATELEEISRHEFLQVFDSESPNVIDNPPLMLIGLAVGRKGTRISHVYEALNKAIEKSNYLGFNALCCFTCIINTEKEFMDENSVDLPRFIEKGLQICHSSCDSQQWLVRFTKMMQISLYDELEMCVAGLQSFISSLEIDKSEANEPKIVSKAFGGLINRTLYSGDPLAKAHLTESRRRKILIGRLRFWLVNLKINLCDISEEEIERDLEKSLVSAKASIDPLFQSLCLNKMANRQIHRFFSGYEVLAEKARERMLKAWHKDTTKACAILSGVLNEQSCSTIYALLLEIAQDRLLTKKRVRNLMTSGFDCLEEITHFQTLDTLEYKKHNARFFLWLSEFYYANQMVRKGSLFLYQSLMIEIEFSLSNLTFERLQFLWEKCGITIEYTEPATQFNPLLSEKRNILVWKNLREKLLICSLNWGIKWKHVQLSMEAFLQLMLMYDGDSPNFTYSPFSPHPLEALQKWTSCNHLEFKAYPQIFSVLSYELLCDSPSITLEALPKFSGNEIRVLSCKASQCLLSDEETIESGQEHEEGMNIPADFLFFPEMEQKAVDYGEETTIKFNKPNLLVLGENSTLRVSFFNRGRYDMPVMNLNLIITSAEDVADSSSFGDCSIANAEFKSFSKSDVVFCLNPQCLGSYTVAGFSYDIFGVHLIELFSPNEIINVQVVNGVPKLEATLCTKTTQNVWSSSKRILEVFHGEEVRLDILLNNTSAVSVNSARINLLLSTTDNAEEVGRGTFQLFPRLEEKKTNLFSVASEEMFDSLLNNSKIFSVYFKVEDPVYSDLNLRIEIGYSHELNSKNQLRYERLIDAAFSLKVYPLLIREQIKLTSDHLMNWESNERSTVISASNLCVADNSSLTEINELSNVIVVEERVFNQSGNDILVEPSLPESLLRTLSNRSVAIILEEIRKQATGFQKYCRCECRCSAKNSVLIPSLDSRLVKIPLFVSDVINGNSLTKYPLKYSIGGSERCGTIPLRSTSAGNFQNDLVVSLNKLLPVSIETAYAKVQPSGLNSVAKEIFISVTNYLAGEVLEGLEIGLTTEQSNLLPGIRSNNTIIFCGPEKHEIDTLHGGESRCVRMLFVPLGCEEILISVSEKTGLLRQKTLSLNGNMIL